ncbi:hypothetical protein [Desulfosporosinus sp. FKA]|uniref:hypothetical protein n=1 Tax=Desulfosporosinus sp. FKA TaxID=1969834 RepID=UPI000B49BEC3|nr:hypothetical protein [Desulfosporosinus sp. FKA]
MTAHKCAPSVFGWIGRWLFCLGQIKKELTKQSLSGFGLGIEMETELWVTSQKCAPSVAGGSGDGSFVWVK